MYSNEKREEKSWLVKALHTTENTENEATGFMYYKNTLGQESETLVFKQLCF